jgi:hypothetical protein
MGRGEVMAIAAVMLVALLNWLWIRRNNVEYDVAK